MKISRTILVVALTVMLLLAVGVAMTSASNPDPQQLTKVQGWATYTFLPATNITATTAITYTGCPYIRAGTNVCIANAYAQADVFVTADVSGTGEVTVTPQVSPDNISWVDVAYQYTTNNVATTSVATGQVVSGTSVLTTTTTTTTSSTSALAYGTYQVVMNADGTQLMRIPLYGEYLRFKYATSTLSNTLGNTIPALQIKVTYKNFQ
jgi:hypothetical protein